MTIKRQFFLLDEELSTNLWSTFGAIIAVVYVLQFIFANVKLKVNSGYYSARFLLFFFMLYCVFFENLVNDSLITIFVIQLMEVFVVIIFSGFGFTQQRAKYLRDFQEIWKKKLPLVVGSLALMILLTLDNAYYPMVVFVPLLVAWIDRLQSHGCQWLPFLIINELIKFAIVLIGCYIPCYFAPFEENLLMGFNYLNLALFIFTGFILLPGLFFLQTLFSKKSQNKAKIVLIRKELHGASKSWPQMIQLGQGDIVATRERFFSRDRPDQYSMKKLLYYSPKLVSGVIEVEVTKLIVRNERVLIRPTGNINFYTYKKRENPAASELPQHCQDLDYKPSIKFKALNRGSEFAMLNLLPVETPECLTEQRFFAITLKSYGKLELQEIKKFHFPSKSLNSLQISCFLLYLAKLFDPKSRKVLIRKNFSAQRIDHGLSANSECGQYKTRAFITGGRLHFLMFNVNNLGDIERRIQIQEVIAEGSKPKIKPFEVFQEGKKL